MNRLAAVAIAVFFAAGAFGQLSADDDALSRRSLRISTIMPRLSGRAGKYQSFFDQIYGLNQFPITREARRLALDDQELRSLLRITADLADESQAFEQNYRRWQFELLMETIELGKHSPELEMIMSGLQDQWARTILDHAEQLRSALGEARFQEVDAFIHSGRQLFTPPQVQTSAPKPIAK